MEQIDWIAWKEFVSFAQMGFALEVGYTVLRLIVAPVQLLFVLAMKALGRRDAAVGGRAYLPSAS